jgi:hypothetical protein
MVELPRLTPAGSNNISAALEFYEPAADFVYITWLHSARHMADLIAGAVQDEDDLEGYREKELEDLKQREELLL